MTNSLRALLIAIVVGALLSPGTLQAGAVVGSAGPSEGAVVRGVALQQGTNIFSGDVVEVAAGGEGVVTFGHNSMARLSELSAMRATKDANNIGLELLRGRMVFRTTPDQPVVGTFADALVRSENGQETVAIISFRNPALVAVTAERGTLAVTAGTDKRTVSVPQGQTVEVSLSDNPPSGANSPAPQQDNPPAGRKSAPAAAFVTGVIIAAGALGAGIALSQNQTHLSCPQKGALVSPFAFPCTQ
jgi:ferric-dicitrate binding protein FerR (iron transport regulator)